MKVIYNGIEFYSNDVEVTLSQDNYGYFAAIDRHFDGKSDTLTGPSVDQIVSDVVNYLYSNLESSVTVHIYDSALPTEDQARAKTLIPSMLSR